MCVCMEIYRAEQKLSDGGDKESVLCNVCVIESKLTFINASPYTPVPGASTEGRNYINGVLCPGLFQSSNKNNLHISCGVWF